MSDEAELKQEEERKVKRVRAWFDKLEKPYHCLFCGSDQFHLGRFDTTTSYQPIICNDCCIVMHIDFDKIDLPKQL